MGQIQNLLPLTILAAPHTRSPGPEISAAPAARAPELESSPAPSSGGRLGGAAVRAQNAAIATQLENEGFTITGGGGKEKEEYIRGTGPGTKGSTYVDITAINDKTGAVVRVQTIDTYADGTPKPYESAAAARIRSKFPNDRLILIPKRRAQ
jgi:filamentous hemagglutinin